MKINKYKIEIEYRADHNLSPASAKDLDARVNEFVKEIVELYSHEESGLAGSGFNFLTKQRDLNIEVGFDKRHTES